MKTLAITAILLAAALAGCANNEEPTADPTPTAAQTPTSTTAPKPASPTPATSPTTAPQLSGDITITGSSTVYPVGQAWAEEFQAKNRNVKIAYNVVGTGGGFKAFCRGEAMLTGASRPIKPAETSDCNNNSITPHEIQIAIDALSVVVSTRNTFAQDLTVTELNKIWTANASKQVNYWDEVRPGAGWPHEKIVLYGPGTDSGTFDYFVETIIHPFDGTSTKGRSDYTPSEDDNVLVQGVYASPYALGYFGLAYVHENADKVKSLKIDGGKGAGPIEPTEANVHAGKYTPLARPIFYYTNGAPTGVVKAFLEYGLSDAGQGLVTEVGYITMPPANLAASKAKVSG